MRTSQEQPRKRRRGRLRRMSMRAGLGLVLLTAGGAGAGLGVSASVATATPTGQVKATKSSHVRVFGGWRAPQARVGHVASLSAGTLPQAAPGVRIGYRWTIVSKPKGSRARVSGSSSAHPNLRPDRPGRYVLQVTTGPLPAGSGNARLSRCTRNCKTRRITVTATIPAGPLGVAVDTISYGSDGWGVQVGSPGAPGSQFYAAPDQSDALQLLVLDRATLALVQNESFANDSAGVEALALAMSSLSDSDLVAITKPDPLVTNTPDDPSPGVWINSALARIGASPVPAEVSTGNAAWSQLGGCSAFSAIGVPGLPMGQAHVNPCVASTNDQGYLGGELQGYFRQDLSNEQNYAFVDDTRVPFDTGDPTADPAVVTVGSSEPGSPVPQQTFTSANLQGGAGFFVVVLDAGSANRWDQYTFPADDEGLSNMADALSGWTDNPNALVIVRSIGKVGAPASSDTVGVQAWDQIASELQRFGASQFYLDALNGGSNSEYAQVGPEGGVGYPSPWAQVATTEGSGTGRLTGLLARDNSAQFYPSESYDPTTLKDTDRPLAGTLPGIISLPPSAWPDRDTQADQNVLACVAQNLDLQMPIESNYTNLNLANNWSGWAAEIEDSSFEQKLTGDSACGPFTQPDATTVIGQLQTEFNDVATVDTLIANLQKPLVDSQGNATQIQSITEQVDNDLATTSSAQTTVDGKAIASDLLWLVSGLPGVDVISGPLNILAGGLALADDANNNDSGVNLPDDQIATTGADLGNQLEEQYTTSIAGLGNMGNILVSDWTKLQDAAQNATASDGAAANWSFTDKQLTQAANVLLLSTRRTAYETLFPITYSLYRLQNGDDSVQSASQYTCAQIYTVRGAPQINTWQPFAGVQAYGSFPVQSPGGNTEQWAFAAATPDVTLASNRSAQVPTASLLSLMFGPPTDSVQTGPLFNPLQFAVETYHDGGQHTTTITHYEDSSGSASSNDLCQVVSTN
jgi:hypothetical protein